MANLSSTIKLKLDSSSVKKGVQDMKSRFKKLGGAMKMGMAVGGVAVAAYFNKFRNEMDRIGKLSKRLNVGVNPLQRIGLAADMAGTDLEAVVKGLQNFAKVLLDTESGSVAYSDSLKVLGLNAAELINMGMEDQLAKVIEGYSLSAQGARELAAMQKLFGRSGAEMITLAKDGVDAYTEALRRSRPVSAEVIADMERLNDEMAVMGQEMQHSFSVGLSGVYKSVKSWGDAAGTEISALILGFKALKQAGDGDFAGAKRTIGAISDVRRLGKQAQEEIWNPATPQQKTGSNTGSKIQSQIDQKRNLYLRERGSGSRDEQRLFDEIKALVAQLKANNKTAVQY